MHPSMRFRMAHTTLYRDHVERPGLHDKDTRTLVLIDIIPLICICVRTYPTTIAEATSRTSHLFHEQQGHQPETRIFAHEQGPEKHTLVETRLESSTVHHTEKCSTYCIQFGPGR